jgi:hypothetical protein
MGMEFWLFVSIAGGLVALVGLGMTVLQFRRGRMSLAELLVILIGFAALILIIAIGEFVWSEPQPLLFTIVVPLWLAIVLLLRRRKA